MDHATLPRAKGTAANPRALCQDHARGLNNHAPCVPRAPSPRPSGSGKPAARAAIQGGACEGEGVTGRDMDHTALPWAKGTATNLRALLQVHTACRDAHRAAL